MNFIKRLFRKKGNQNKLQDSERQLLDLLLDGDTEFLRALRRQWEEPFFSEVRRYSSSNALEISLAMKGALMPDYAVQPIVEISITDLVIRDNRIQLPIFVEGKVWRGILSNIWLRTHQEVHWPASISVDDWCYLRDGEVDFTNKTRIQKFDLPVLPLATLDEALKNAPLWLKDLIEELPEARTLWHVRYPATDEDLAEAEKRLGVALPPDLVELLRFSDGAAIGGDDLLTAADLSVHSKRRELLIFGNAPYGGEYALDLEHPNSEGHLPIMYIDHEEGEIYDEVPSIRDWVKRAMTS